MYVYIPTPYLKLSFDGSMFYVAAWLGANSMGLGWHGHIAGLLICALDQLLLVQLIFAICN